MATDCACFSNRSCFDLVWALRISLCSTDGGHKRIYEVYQRKKKKEKKNSLSRKGLVIIDVPHALDALSATRGDDVGM